MANQINIGSLNVSSFKVGSNDCSIYLGTVKLYPSLPKISATYIGGTTYSKDCDGSSTLTTGDTRPSGYQYTAMTSAVIGDCVTTINTQAFRYHYSLTSVTLSSTITSIGGSAFQGCSGLTSINIPDGVKNIKGTAFSGCTSLTSITLPDSVTFLETSVFEGCSGLTSATVGSGLTAITGSTFRNCYSLTSVTIPDTITTIGTNAFRMCRSLPSITIPSGVTSIGDGAFAYCSGLTSITVEATTPPTLGSVPFANTTAPIYVPCNSVEAYKTAWPDYASRITCIPVFSGKFKATYRGGTSYSADCDGSSTLTTGDTRPSGHQYSAMTSAEIGDCVTSIGGLAFSYHKSLTSVTIPDSVTSIGEFAFNACSDLTSLDIPSGVTSIGRYAIHSCSGLTSLDIPSGVTSIGENAFFQNSGLQSVTVRATTPPTLGTQAFDQTNNCTIYVPSESLNAYKSASGWSTYESRIQAIPT